MSDLRGWQPHGVAVCGISVLSVQRLLRNMFCVTLNVHVENPHRERISEARFSPMSSQTDTERLPMKI
jgi:hypothetical protein